ncbi:VWA domain-containing protein [Kutzneria viridogrisea]|uniref:UPF0353 protein n=2 Tax=Kutzneria TaxID=43356 RepID=W5W6F7_9PSEU|nr:VWA domain-containing protein [Kutzneria albida]AHH96350.1 UPF0353 protein [Kutzneria albida DSM 43870]MBA8928435.1 Ca-activated chloride channel family protein [Kutzneria viridogrisea]
MSLTGFADPLWFLLLILVAALGLGYLWMLRRRRRDTARYTDLSMLDRVAPVRPGWQRHVPPALLLVALVLLTVALAGPTAELKVPRNRATVMLTVDVSESMAATDVAPSRLAAAQQAAKSFVDKLTPGVNLGLVSFAGSATVLVSPTNDREQVRQGIDALKLSQGTATGEAIAAAVQAVQSFGKLISGVDGPPPARIVLMSDGKENTPADLNAERGAFTQARAAKAAQMPVSAISFGTSGGSITQDGQSTPVPVDEVSMRQIAALSGGDFYRAQDAGQLQQVYGTLAEQIGYETKQADASRSWLVLGALTALASVAAALLLTQRLP